MYNVTYTRNHKEDGQILIFALVLMVIVSTLVVAMVGYSGLQIKAHRQALAREQGIDIAEAGAELAIWKLNNQAGYSGETNTAYGNGVYTVTITNLSASSKVIKVDSYVPNSSNPTAHRIIQLTTTIGTTNIGFNYGVQVGAGGLVMDNNSSVTGNVYSNGNITGASGTSITGTAIAAGSTGTISSMTVTQGANAHTVSNDTITGNVNANTISGGTHVTGNASVEILSNCTITGNASYNSKISCPVSGTSTTPNPSVPADPTAQNLPIDQTQIDDWTTEATNGGVVATQNISGTVSLGPKKINGDLNLGNNSILTVTGTLWVTGNITFSNNVIMKLSSGYGALSGVVMAGTSGSATAGNIDMGNNTQILGSGTAGSYLLLLSQQNSTTGIAINVSNNVTGAIIYAGTGVIDVSNNAGAKELTGYKIHLNNNASVTYETGLASSEFSSGPAGGWEYQDQTWQQIQ